MTIKEHLSYLINERGLINEFSMWSIDTFLEDFISRLKPRIKDCVEVGTCNGISTLVLARYAKSVFTFDVAYRNAEYIWSFFPELRKKIIAFSGPQNVLEFSIIDMLAWKEAWRLNFNFAFIDGEHSYEAVKRDFSMVKFCRRILFHDVQGLEVGRFTKNELGVEIVDTSGIYGYWEEKNK